MSTALVVEQSSGLRRLLAASLRQLDFEVTTLSSGEAVCETASRLRPSFICLDLALPDIGGLDLCEQLRNAPETADVPILVTSTRRTPLDSAHAEMAGADDYLVKPFDLAAFADHVRKISRIRAAQPMRLMPSLATVPA